MFNELYMSVIQDFIQDENQYEFENRQCSENLVRAYLFFNLPVIVTKLALNIHRKLYLESTSPIQVPLARITCIVQ